MLILRAADRAPAPWKNGGGATREIAIWPPGADLSGFDWRISMATVSASGPFSIFPGVDRRLAVLEGNLTLHIEGRGPRRLTARSAPVAFPGDVPAFAETPDKPVTDLNVMTRRGRVHARVERLRANRPRTVTATEAGVILSLSAGLKLTHMGHAHELDRYDAALIEDGLIRVECASSIDVFVVQFERFLPLGLNE